MAARQTLEPRWTASKVAATFVAAAVHLLTVALLLGGAALVMTGLGNPFAMLAGAIMMWSAWFMRPRLGSEPDEDVVTRDQAPELHALVDQIAAALGTRTADVLVVDDRFNASWSVFGLRRHRVLGLGLPLVNVLDGHERIALIAHELAHERNGDARRGAVVGSSIVALGELYALIAPGPRLEDTGMGSLGLVAAGVLWLVSRPVAGLLALQSHLLWLDSRRAEFLADARAAHVAGTEAVVALHEKLLLEPAIDAVVRRLVNHGNDAGIDVFAEARRAMTDVPAHERERRRRVARHEQAQLDATHPPVGQRIAVLEQRPHEPGELALGHERETQIETELRACRETLGRRIVEQHRSSLYR
jgi:Zn-dependent protease with chaperone function